MKRVYVIILLAFAATSAQAQKLNATNIPATVKLAFSKLHAGILKVNWSKEGANFEAEFSLNGKETSEVYTAGGVFVESEVEIELNQLPAAVKDKLKGRKVDEAAKITKADGSVVYEAEVKGKDLLFDSNGNSIRR